MAALFIGLWIAGGIPAGILGEVVQAESARTRRLGRIAFAFLLWIDLLIAALVLAVGALTTWRLLSVKAAPYLRTE